RGQIFRHHPGDVRRPLSEPGRRQCDASAFAAERDSLGDHLQRLDHHRPDPARLTRRKIPPAERRPAAVPQPGNLRLWRRGHPLHRHQGDRRRQQCHRPDLRKTPMLKELPPAIAVLLALTLITGIIYPLAMTGIAQLVFTYQANGSLLRDNDGKVIGSELIGQNFTSPKYFQGRPSVTTGTDAKGNSIAQPYNAVNSHGSRTRPPSP